jgi:uncharacterized protein DUF2188
MPQGDVETYHQDDSWHSKVEGEQRPFASGGTKADQIVEGRDRARTDKVEHIIKDENGRIAERHSYGHDPRNVPG